MNIMPMLVRLESALGLTNLIDQILLTPERSAKGRQKANLKTSTSTRRGPKRHSQSEGMTHPAGHSDSSQDINLVVGYNSSPKSQTALDLTLWLAHQTRLATRRQVTVQVVYVVSPTSCLDSISAVPDFRQVSPSKSMNERGSRLGTSVVEPTAHAITATLPNLCETADLRLEDYPLCQAQQFEQADRILWQARCLANEWRGSLKTHLRFGQVAKELRSVVQEESAALLWLGCETANNQIVRELGRKFPCPVLGVPSALHPDRYFDA